MIKKYIKFIFSLLLAVLIVSSFGYAQFSQAGTQKDINDQLNNAGQKGWGVVISDSNSLPRIAQYVISAFLGLLGIIFLVLIIYAGFNWMTAQGDEEKVTLAKNTLTRAIIGLVIITAAYSITYFVFSSLPGGGGAPSTSEY